MAGSSSPADDEDAIFNSPDDTNPATGNDSVPASDDDLPRPHEPVDARMVSNAIRGLIPQGRTHGAAAPPPPPPPAKTPPEGQQQPPTNREQQPLTPREAAFLEQMRQERQRRQELERRYQPQPGPEGPQGQPPPDLAQLLFEKPEEFIGLVQRQQQQMQEAFAQQIAQLRLDSDLNLAEIKHGEVFRTGFKALMDAQNEQPDQQLYFRIMNSPSPGEEIVKWYREQGVLREVGEDPEAYKQRVIQDYLASQGQHGQQPTARQQVAQQAPRNEDGTFAPRHEVRLPTATGRLSGSPAANQGAEDGSEDAIFDAARPSRRR